MCNVCMCCWGNAAFGDTMQICLGLDDVGDIQSFEGDDKNVFYHADDMRTAGEVESSRYVSEIHEGPGSSKSFRNFL